MKGSTLFLIIFVVSGFGLIFITHSKRNYPLQKFERTIKKTYSQHLYEDRDRQLKGLQELDTLKAEIKEEDSVRYHLALTRYYKLKANFSKALIHCEQAINLKPKETDSTKEQALDWELPLLHGIILLQLKNPSKALESLEQAWKQNSQSKHIALYLSQTHHALATDTSDKSKLHIDNAHKYAQLALKLSEIKADDENPARSFWAPAWNQRAVVLMRKKEYHNARLDLLEALSLRPQFARAQYNLAICSATLSLYYLKPKTKNDEKALSYRSEAIRAWQELKIINPKLAQVLYVDGGIQNLIEGAMPH